MKLDIGSRTDVGRRRDHNEDDLAICDLATTADSPDRQGVLLLVADGMGGQAAGEVASHTAVDTIRAIYCGDASDRVEERLARALRAANATVHEAAQHDARYTGMGTTLAAAVLLDGELIATNVGDCRVYLWRRGQLTQLTKDQSLVAELLATGRITPEEATHHPMRNLVTRSVGGKRGLPVEVYPRRTLEEGDVVVLCTDGLWGMVADQHIASTVATNAPQRAAEALVDLANSAGGHDNITAVVCRVSALAEEGNGDTTVLLDLPTQEFPSIGP